MAVGLNNGDKPVVLYLTDYEARKLCELLEYCLEKEQNINDGNRDEIDAIVSALTSGIFDF